MSPARRAELCKALRGEGKLAEAQRAPNQTMPASSRDFTLLGLSELHWQSHFLLDLKRVSRDRARVLHPCLMRRTRFR